MPQFWPHCLLISGTKLNKEFPNCWFLISDYEIKSWRDWNKHGRGLLQFVSKGLTYKAITIPFNITSEIISSELTIKNKKWIVLSMYRPPKESDLIKFFQGLIFLLKKHWSTYNNVVVMGDFNIHVKVVTNQSLDKLITFCKTFCLLIKFTLVTVKLNSSIVLVLTNKTPSFQLTKATETGISHAHLLISTYMKA